MKIIYTLFFVFLFSSSFAQIDKGTWMFAGGGGLDIYTNSRLEQPDGNPENVNYTEIKIEGSVGYFFLDRFAVGLRPGFNVRMYSKIPADDQYSLALGPFARYYFLKRGKSFNILADAAYQRGINWGREYAITGGADFFSLKGGTEIFFNDATGFEILFGYAYNSYKNNNPNSIVSTSTTDGFQTSIGLVIHLFNNKNLK